MESTANLDLLCALGRRRWTLPLLAQFAQDGGQRFVQLLHRLQLPRDSLARTLQEAERAGWIMRNPGHGHPLRPEYILTAAGEAVAELALKLRDALISAGLDPGGLPRWALPVILELGQGHDRFNDLARALDQSTPRALSQSLRFLVAEGLVERRVQDGFPPSSRYILSASGSAIHASAQRTTAL